MSYNDPSRRYLEAQERRLDGAPVDKKQEEQTATVLHDSSGLKEAALAASNNGKRKIVGLYTPDGNRILLEERNHKDKDAKEKKKPSSGLTVKDLQKEQARKKTNLSEAAHHFNQDKTYKERRAAKLQKNSEDIRDEAAQKKAIGILSKSSELQRGAYRDLFNFFDVDKDQNWGSIEFAQRMTDIGFSTGVEDAANLLYFAGVADVDRITYEDFIAMMPKLTAFRRVIEKDAIRHFSHFDDGSGHVSLKELEQLLDRLAGPEPFDPEFVAMIIKKADRERTGRITHELFIRALFGSKPIIPYVRDVKEMTLKQRILAFIGKWCGTFDDDDYIGGEIEQDNDAGNKEDFFDHAKHNAQKKAHVDQS